MEFYDYDFFINENRMNSILAFCSPLRLIKHILRAGQNLITDEHYRFEKDVKTKFSCHYCCVNSNCENCKMPRKIPIANCKNASEDK